MRMSTKILPYHGLLAEPLERMRQSHQESEREGRLTHVRTGRASETPENRFRATSLPLSRPRWIFAKPPEHIGSNEISSIVPSTYNFIGTSPQALERSTSMRRAVF